MIQTFCMFIIGKLLNCKDDKNVKIINGHRVVPIDVAVKNDALFLIPEPKSPSRC